MIWNLSSMMEGRIKLELVDVGALALFPKEPCSGNGPLPRRRQPYMLTSRNIFASCWGHMSRPTCGLVGNDLHHWKSLIFVSLN